jgi:hypothetical protein
MGEHRPVDLTKQLGGVLGVGTHKNVRCVEKWDGGDSTDFIFRNGDGQEHRQRVWKKARYSMSFKLGAVYNIKIEMSTGTHKIDATPEGGYNLVSLYNGVSELKSYTISACYKKLKELGGRLSRPTIVWSEELKDNLEDR